MTANLSSSSFNSSGRSSDASHTPISGRAASASFCACHVFNGTMTLPAGTSTVAASWPSARRSTVQSSATMAWPLMMRWVFWSGIFVFSNQASRGIDRRGINIFFEWGDTEALGGVDEALVRRALTHVHLQQAVDHFRHLLGRERRADDLADGGVVALGSADRHLVPFASVLVDAEDA